MFQTTCARQGLRRDIKTEIAEAGPLHLRTRDYTSRTWPRTHGGTAAALGGTGVSCKVGLRRRGGVGARAGAPRGGPPRHRPRFDPPWRAAPPGQLRAAGGVPATGSASPPAPVLREGGDRSWLRLRRTLLRSYAKGVQGCVRKGATCGPLSHSPLPVHRPLLHFVTRSSVPATEDRGETTAKEPRDARARPTRSPLSAERARVARSCRGGAERSGSY